MAKDPAYPMYAQDFDMDTASWSALAVGVHVRLMNYSWVNGPLPDDTEALARIVRMDHGNFRKVWYPFVQPKWTKTDEGLVSSRMEIEREKRQQYVDSQREAGKRGAEKRWKKDSDPNGNPNNNPNGEKVALHSHSLEKKKDLGDAPKKPKAPPNPEVKIFLTYAFETFQQTFNDKMLVDGKKDGGIVKGLLGTYSLERLKGLWDAFMESDDPFIAQAGRTIGVFRTQINKLISGEGARHSPGPVFGLTPEQEAHLKKMEEKNQ